MKKLIALITSWLFFSPLFLFLSIRWKKPKLILRIILTTIAPLTLLILLAISWNSFNYYYFHIKRGNRSEIEAKTGLDFPKYKTIEKRHNASGPYFNGDFSMEYTVQLDTLDIDGFYSLIKEKIETLADQSNDSVIVSWETYSEGNYSFSYNDYQEVLFLRIDGKTGEMKIIYGDM